jgi:cobalt-zinc-cadmium efflux system membrane fusion protein
VLVVPRDAVVTVEGRSAVFVEHEAARFERRFVQLGRSGGERVEVRTGLTEGETVAIDGAFLLKSELGR